MSPRRNPVIGIAAATLGVAAGVAAGIAADRGCRDTDDGVAAGTEGHALPSAPMWIRGTRGPSRVTIS